MLEASRITTIYSVALSHAQSHSLSLSLFPPLSRNVSNLLLTIDLPSRSLSLSLSFFSSRLIWWLTIRLHIIHRDTHTCNKIELALKTRLNTSMPRYVLHTVPISHMTAGRKATKQCRRHGRKGSCRICITAKGPGANASHVITLL